MRSVQGKGCSPEGAVTTVTEYLDPRNIRSARTAVPGRMTLLLTLLCRKEACTRMSRTLLCRKEACTRMSRMLLCESYLEDSRFYVGRLCCTRNGLLHKYKSTRLTAAAYHNHYHA